MIKIAVGCGKRVYPGYIHVDGDTSFEHVVDDDVYLNKFEDRIDVIYACHLLNYFSYREVPILLKAWFDKLKDGGKLRLAVPDFEALTNLYWNHPDGSLAIIKGPLIGEWQMGDKIIYHKSVWDYINLSSELKSIGFEMVYKYDWRTTDTANVDDHSQAYYPHMDKEKGTLVSLNIEAWK